MGKEVLFATNNPNKIQEARIFFDMLDWTLLTSSDVGIDFFPEESKDTFAGNSLIKALHGAKKSGLTTVGEDSGICVKAMDYLPGLHSKRWAADQGKDFLDIIHRNVLGKDSSAYMISVLSIVSSHGNRMRLCSGKVTGRIVNPAGQEGFGYDPVFMPDGHNRTFGEMGREEKSKFSHRAASFQNLIRHTRV